MRKDYVKKCLCKACTGFSNLGAQESALHTFIGNSPPNVSGEVSEFQSKLEFTNALHWDVGFSGEARYYIYRDNEGNLLAWYDRFKKAGFRSDFDSLICNVELMEEI